MPTMTAPEPTALRPAAFHVVATAPKVGVPAVQVGAPEIRGSEADVTAPPVDRRLEQARRLAETARTSAAAAFPFSADRAEWLGVLAAAEQVLRPEVTAVEGIDWLVRLHPEFIASYVRTSASLASAWSWPRDRRAATSA